LGRKNSSRKEKNIVIKNKKGTIIIAIMLEHQFEKRDMFTFQKLARAKENMKIVEKGDE